MSNHVDFDALAAGRTIATAFAETVAAHSGATALRWKEGEGWGELTYAQYADQACRVAASLRAVGVERGDRVVLMMRNRPEFHVADVAVLLVGATPISIYNSSAPDQIEYLVGHCRASVAIVEDITFLERVLKVKDQLPNLRSMFVIDDADDLRPEDVGLWSELLASDPVALADAATIAQPDDLATVIYTSGTTGPPKGVMLDHRNIVWTAEAYRHILQTDPTGWRVVSYLPMAHIAERMSSHYLGILSAFEVTTCPDAGLVAQYLPETRPQSFFAVPRVWEKFEAALRAALGGGDDEARARAEAGLDVGWQVSELAARGEEPTGELAAINELVAPVLAGVRERIGLDLAQVCVTGAAPIPFETLKFFRALGLPLSEIYGLSETSGPMTWAPFAVKVGKVGHAFPGVEVKLADDGEVICRGGNVYRGYLDAPDKTAEVLTDDGWFHSGDIGEFDDDGYLKIVDRKKELIITAGGKNISPANLEAALKGGRLIGQACAIGDGRPFVGALLVLDAEAAPVWAAANGLGGRSLDELAAHPDVIAEIQREVDAANANFSQVEKIKKFVVLSQEWLPDSDELTPTMKLKRRGVHTKYADEIESMFA